MLSTIKLHNFSISTSSILIVSTSKVVYKIWISNLKTSQEFIYDKMISNQKLSITKFHYISRPTTVSFELIYCFKMWFLNYLCWLSKKILVKEALCWVLHSAKSFFVECFFTESFFAWPSAKSFFAECPKENTRQII